MHELHDIGSIRVSQSPFSSPVLLVRKANENLGGGGGMCIDYKSLNKATVKDKYPILVVDELLDKLVVLPFSLCWILDQDIIKLG